MSRRLRHTALDGDSDDFAPGTDLILGFLAVMIIVLAISYAIPVTETPETGVDQTETISVQGCDGSVLAQLETISTPNLAGFMKDLDRITRAFCNEIDEAKADSETETTSVTHGTSDADKASEFYNQTVIVEDCEGQRIRLGEFRTDGSAQSFIDALQKRLRLRCQDKKGFEKQLDEQDEKIAALEAKIVSLDPGPWVPPEAIALRTKGANSSLFKRNSAELTAIGKDLINVSLIQIQSKVIATDANHLNVVGLASPEPKPTKEGQDGNLLLSTERATSVTYYLASRGVPYECMTASGVGRGRSNIIYDKYGSKITEDTLARWDQYYSKAVSSGIRKPEQWEAMIAQERRVEIYPVLDGQTKCDHAKLVSTLDSAIRRIR
ncbi:MAG: hypothetical protein ACPGOY_13400 [Rhodospirillaceae bacterium]